MHFGFACLKICYINKGLVYTMLPGHTFTLCPYCVHIPHGSGCKSHEYHMFLPLTPTPEQGLSSDTNFKIFYLAFCLTGGDGGCRSYWFPVHRASTSRSCPLPTKPYEWLLAPPTFSSWETSGVRLVRGSALIGRLRDDTRLGKFVAVERVAMVAWPLSIDDSTHL